MSINRRRFLYKAGSAASVALSAILHQEQARAAGVLAPKPQQIPAKAKACIFLTMEGGPSHIDTFDPKPKLEKLHMSEFVRKDKFASAMESGTRYFVQSPFKFRKVGQAGAGTRRTLDRWLGPFQTTPELHTRDLDLGGLNRCETKSPAQRSDSAFSIPL